jgi:uncharacterized protein (DUF3820 family)
MSSVELPVDTQEEENFDYVNKWTMRFGKNKGVMFGEIDDQYLRWCYKNGIIKNEKVEGYLESRFGESGDSVE